MQKVIKLQRYRALMRKREQKAKVVQIEYYN